MKGIQIAIKVFILLIVGFILVLCSLDLINFCLNPEDYPFGSEVVDKGGWAYYSKFTFILFNAIMILLSFLLSFLTIRNKEIKFQLLLLFLAICQILCLIIL